MTGEQITVQELDRGLRTMSTRHFNNLTPAEAERLALLSEECGELVQAIGKILRHGYGSHRPCTGTENRESLMREMGDVRAAMIIMCEAGDVSEVTIHAAADDKLQRVGEYLHHQKKGCP